MERKGVKTCAGCLYGKERVIKGCLVAKENYCSKGMLWSLSQKDCRKYESRFKRIVKNKMEVELL